ERMAPVNAAGALTALADVDVELPVNGLARHLDLKLLSDVRRVERAATAGADLGQRCLINLIYLFGRRWPPVGLGAVVLAGLAAGFARVRFGLALGEGAGLALAGAEGRVELTAEPLVLGLQFVKSSLKGLAVGTRDGMHTCIIGEGPTATAGPQRRSRDQLQLDALNRYRNGSPLQLLPR